MANCALRTKAPLLATLSAAVLTMCAIPSTALGQNVSITPYSGYRFGGSLTVRQGELQLADAPFFGGQLDFRMRTGATGSLLVDYQPTSLRLKEFGASTTDLFDIGVWYFQAGGTLETNTRSQAVPFVIGTLGMSMFDPGSNSDNASSEYGFSGIFGGGVKVPLQSGRMGLRLQARVLLNSLQGGSSFWCGTGGGCYVGTGGYLGPVQFDVGGGLTFGGR